MPNAVYLSPHLDDAIYSCGGLIARQVSEGHSITVLTVFAGDPPPGPVSPFARELHERWQGGAAAMDLRRQEDLEACARLGAAALHMGLPEAVYRKASDGDPLYPTEQSIFGPSVGEDEIMVERLAEAIDQVSPAGSQLYAPVGIGGHIDHGLTRRAAQQLDRPLWLYHDFPYAARGFDTPPDFPPKDGVSTMLPLDEPEIEDWVQAIWRYQSQQSTFWEDLPALRKELKAYLSHHHGIPIVAPSRRRSAG
ncbi:MAG: PIG-L family deacetylase [Anaerolineales bacterium]